jgi:hypothetical protein
VIDYSEPAPCWGPGHEREAALQSVRGDAEQRLDVFDNEGLGVEVAPADVRSTTDADRELETVIATMVFWLLVRLRKHDCLLRS